jgi:hypothetical protein
MKKPLLLNAALALTTLAFVGCETTQGPSRAVTNQQTAGQMAPRIEPKPESKSFPGEKDVFRGAVHEMDESQIPPGAKRIQLRLGQVTEVFRGSFAPGDGQRELAFYLPIEARSVVRLDVETRGFTRTYFLKAIGVGDTVGGVVERRWLNSAGTDPNHAGDEARIQDAVRASPYFISVYN